MRDTSRPPECKRCGVPLAPGKTPVADLPEGHQVHAGRGLCTRCRNHLVKHDPDTLLDYERPTVPASEVVKEWELLRNIGLSRRRAAERIGISYGAFNAALARERQR